MNEIEVNDDLEYENRLRDALYTEARAMTIDKLQEFMEKLKEYRSGYGSCCIALAAGALATAWAFSREFGITGFQASISMWEFVRHWNYTDNKCGLRLVDWDNMLYPQYEYRFQKTITSDTWEALQREASKHLADGHACDAVLQHWQSICDGVVPFGYTITEESK